MRIILVDDEWNSLDLLERMIQTIDVNADIVGKFQNPLEAIPHILAQQPDVLFIDVEMPLLHGIDLVKMLSYLDCNFVLITGGDAMHWIISDKLERTQQLQKPFLMRDLRYILLSIDKKSKTTANNPDTWKENFFWFCRACWCAYHFMLSNLM